MLKNGLPDAIFGLLLKHMFMGATWKARLIFTLLVIDPTTRLSGATAGPLMMLSTCAVRLQHGVSLLV